MCVLANPTAAVCKRAVSTATRYLVGCSYLGTGYSGFTINADSHLPSVLGTVTESMTKFLSAKSEFGRLVASSRTDRGVHAVRNTFHVDIYRQEGMKCFSREEVQNGLNFYLRPTCSLIRISDVEVVSSSFDARRNACERVYVYRIFCPKTVLDGKRGSSLFLFHSNSSWVLKQPLDIASMRLAVEPLIGTEASPSQVLTLSTLLLFPPSSLLLSLLHLLFPH